MILVNISRKRLTKQILHSYGFFPQQQHVWSLSQNSDDSECLKLILIEIHHSNRIRLVTLVVRKNLSTASQVIAIKPNKSMKL